MKARFPIGDCLARTVAAVRARFQGTAQERRGEARCERHGHAGDGERGGQDRQAVPAGLMLGATLALVSWALLAPF